MNNGTEYQNLLEVSYRKYQFDWMNRHGYSIDDIISGMQQLMYSQLSSMRTVDDYLGDCIDDTNVSGTVVDDTYLTSLYAEWKNYVGFPGDTLEDNEMWKDEEEFEESDFKDYDYMENLLSQREFNIWKQFFG